VETALARVAAAKENEDEMPEDRHGAAQNDDVLFFP
jgi:hypothetical protein